MPRNPTTKGSTTIRAIKSQLDKAIKAKSVKALISLHKTHAKALKTLLGGYLDEYWSVLITAGWSVEFLPRFLNILNVERVVDRLVKSQPGIFNRVFTVYLNSSTKAKLIKLVKVLNSIPPSQTANGNVNKCQGLICDFLESDDCVADAKKRRFLTVLCNTKRDVLQKFCCKPIYQHSTISRIISDLGVPTPDTSPLSESTLSEQTKLEYFKGINTPCDEKYHDDLCRSNAVIVADDVISQYLLSRGGELTENETAIVEECANKTDIQPLLLLLDRPKGGKPTLKQTPRMATRQQQVHRIIGKAELNYTNADKNSHR